MKTTRTWLLLVGALLLSLLPLTAAAGVTEGLEQPDALRTHGWICINNHDPFVHICVP